MRPGDLLSGAAFKAAALSILIFLVVASLAGFAIMESVRRAMTNELNAQILAELVLFDDIYQRDGPEGVVDAVDELSKTYIQRQHLVGVFSPDGARLAGNIPVAPDFMGWGTVKGPTIGVFVRDQVALALEAPKDNSAYYANVVSRGDHVLILGRSLRQVDVTMETLAKVLIFAGFVVVIPTLLAGLMISRSVFGKLERMASVLERVSRGESASRLAVGSGGDQIDRVSALINVHLDRLSASMDAVRNTIAAVAHDLRTPLNRLSLQLQIAESGERDGDEREAAIKAAGEELQAIGETFDAILRIARISSSDDRSIFVRLPVAPLLHEILETYEPVFADSGQSLSLGEVDETAAILGDRRMLWQAIVNLVENANRYAPEGATVGLSARSEGSDIVIEVSDDGPGIPAERREEVLKPFSRGGPLRDLGGAGLGLALVRAVAERHGATFTLRDNEPGLRAALRFLKANLAEM